jgi:hypothetical protein
MSNQIDRFRRQRLLARRMEQEQQQSPIKACGGCEHAFEHLNGYGDYVCDIDVHPIKLNLERVDCPRRIPMQEAA